MSKENITTYEQDYEVESIVKHRYVGSKPEFFIKWKGYSSEENTWEPVEHLPNCIELIQEYFKKHNKTAETSQVTNFWDAQAYPIATIKIDSTDSIDLSYVDNPFSFRKYKKPKNPTINRVIGIQNIGQYQYVEFEGHKDLTKSTFVDFDTAAILMPDCIFDWAQNQITSLEISKVKDHQILNAYEHSTNMPHTQKPKDMPKLIPITSSSSDSPLSDLESPSPKRKFGKQHIKNYKSFKNEQISASGVKRTQPQTEVHNYVSKSQSPMKPTPKSQTQQLQQAFHMSSSDSDIEIIGDTFSQPKK